MLKIKRLPLAGAYFALMLSALLVISIGRFTNIDLIIEDYYYSPELHVFIWKNSWFAQQLMHVYVKYIMILIACSCIGFVVIDTLSHFKFIDAWARDRLRFVAIAAVLIPFIITGLKQASALHCPWDVQRYGGAAPYLRLFDAIPANIESGHCFPAGHASTGLWLAAFCVFWLPHRPRLALVVFFAGLGIGFLFGWVQQMRGAHFLTHTFTSVWIATAIILIMLSFSQSAILKSKLIGTTSAQSFFKTV